MVSGLVRSPLHELVSPLDIAEPHPPCLGGGGRKTEAETLPLRVRDHGHALAENVYPRADIDVVPRKQSNIFDMHCADAVVAIMSTSISPHSRQRPPNTFSLNRN